MALVVADRVKETTTTTGTGTVTLAGAEAGFQSFAAVGDGNTTYYAIVDSGVGDWEVGLGTYTASGTTLSRDTVISSSNAGSAVSFSAGSKDVFVTYPSDKAVYEDASGNVGIGTSSPGTKFEVAAPSSSGAVSNGIAVTNAGSGSGTGSSLFLGYGTTIGKYGSVSGFYDGTGTALSFGTSPTASSAPVVERARIDSSGNLLPGANNTYDLGSSSLRWANIYTNDLHLSNGIGDYTVVEGEEDLFLHNNKTGKVFKFALIEVDPSESPPKAEK